MCHYMCNKILKGGSSSPPVVDDTVYTELYSYIRYVSATVRSFGVYTVFTYRDTVVTFRDMVFTSRDYRDTVFTLDS